MTCNLSQALAAPVRGASPPEEVVLDVVAGHLLLGGVELRGGQLFGTRLVRDGAFLNLLVVATWEITLIL